jgi:hypothetical protein
MSRRWLLSLLCLSVLFVSLAPLTRARGELKVNEARTRFLLQKEPVEVLLAIENSSGESLNAKIDIELLDPQNRVISQVSGIRPIGTSNQSLTLSLPFYFSKLEEDDRRKFLWHRLHYRISKEGQSERLAEGLVSLSEITPDLFEIRVATAEVAREATRYRSRIIARHPLTNKPAANVLVEGELTLEADDDKSVKIKDSKNTDSDGNAILEFVVPNRFPQFPHTIRPAGGELHVVGKRGAFVADAEGEVPVDQFTRILISTDKPIYQPGQTMHLRALTFTPSMRALANQNIVIKVSDPEDTTVSQVVVKSSRFGIASTDWVIPDNVRLGDYRIMVGVEGSEEYNMTPYGVRISRYDLPNFSVSVQPNRQYYLPGQNAEVKVRGDYLFGQPLKRGHVRVVRETEREWNYREQKWDVNEGEEQEGETDANGLFVAHLDLSDDYENLQESSYQRYNDLTYAAYFTDPTTNRTEQRRFDVRITKEPIHVYVITTHYRNRSVPLKFYVSTSYADGSPARCKVNVTLSNASDDSEKESQDTDRRRVVTLRTNRFGVGKVSGLRLPREFQDEGKLELTFSATDSNGRTGTRTEDLNLDDDDLRFVETDKAIYRTGEPIIASITSSVPDENVIVDLVRESNVITSQRLRLRNGRGSVTFPYTSDFKDILIVAAYPAFAKDLGTVEAHAVLYPRNVELQVNVQTPQTTYRPGENAHVKLNVRGPEGRGAESALGVIVLDKAVEERFRTMQEFGGAYGSFNSSLQQFLGLDLAIGGMTLRDLQRLNTANVISSDLDLVAEVMLNQSWGYYPRLFGGDRYDTAQAVIFGGLIDKQIEAAKNAITRHYATRKQYPKNEAELQGLLSENNIDYNRLLDPWGVHYRPVFSLEGPSDVLTLMTAGADKRFDTEDDFSVAHFEWRYFLTIGQTINRAIRQHHERTNGFIRDYTTLRDELYREGVALDQLRDRWGQPYRFEFTIDQGNYVLTVSSGGPDKRFSQKSYEEDDFLISVLSIDYFADIRTRIQEVLDQNLKRTKKFPQSEPELRDSLLNSGTPFDSLRDPWAHPYYATFNIQTYSTGRAQLESRARLGETPATHVAITPVTQRAATIELRSMGPDGVSGTRDDFTVATLRGVLYEQARGESGPQVAAVQAVLSGNNGAIYGIVTDAQGASIPGVKVTAVQTAFQNRYESVTDDEGKYTISNLPPGAYEVHFERPGFVRQIISEVTVPVAGFTRVNASLQVASITETVTVSAGAGPGSFVTLQSASVSRSVAIGKQFRVITKSGGSLVTTPHLREYFPETLVWQPSLETDKRGRAKIDFKLADNITTWKLAVLGSTEDGRIGTTETEIKSFQPFFVEHDPPRVLTEGDEISLPVVVRNYLQQTQKVALELKPENWFSLRGPSRKGTLVAADDASRETFNIRATSSIKDGKQRITAIAADGNDAIEKPVTVHPDGEESSVSDSDILGGSATLQLQLPENMIPNSNQSELKIYPNLMAHVIESVEAIMSRPYGCGEQTISSSYPSLLLLRQGKSSGEESPLRSRAERYLSLGYSRLLNYRDESGGFTYWGRGKPDLALTAYAIRFLSDARDMIPVDEEVIDDAQRWLIKEQQADGSWLRESRRDTEKSRQAAILTAYIARVLASAGGEASKEKAEALKLALAYLSTRAPEIDEPYLIASYALAAIKVQDISRAKSLISKLATLVHREGNTNYWSLETNTPFYGWGLTGRVETTALVVQALTAYCSLPTAKCESDPKLAAGGLLFLLKQKDRYGVWYSTQATINVLDALLTVLTTQSQTRANSESQATADVVVNERLVDTFKLPATASRLMSPITVDISRFVHTGKNTIRIKRAEGSPFASVQALASFYEPWPGASGNTETRTNDLRLQAKCDKTEGRVGDEFTCHVEAERIASRGYGMMLAEIGVPPGADVDRSSLETAMKGSGWVINQYDVLPDRVVVYLWPYAGGAKFDFKFRARFGLNAKSAASVLYDYYNPEARAVVPPVTFKVRE